MKVKIAKDKLLVAALEPGKDLQDGDVVEVAAHVGRDWIAKGWATEVAEPAPGPRQVPVK